MSDPPTCQKLCYFDDSGFHWKRDALHRWLSSYSRMEEILLIRALKLGGAPCRITEIASLCYCNTIDRDRRNLAAIANYLTFIVRYTKTGSVTQADHYIPHALDAFTASLLLHDLALVRPMAEIVAHVLYPDNIEVAKLYKSRMFVNRDREFSTDRLTQTIGKMTETALGTKLTISSWRHISVAWRNALCPEVFMYIDHPSQPRQERIGALQAGHNTRTEDENYGLLKGVLYVVVANKLYAYLRTSVHWQFICRTVPGK